MKTAFWLGLVVGLSGVLAGSHFFPWVVHERLPSNTSVVANGGRGERFLIRLPADRVSSGGGPANDLRGAPVFATIELPQELRADPLLVEHFKVRDSAGNVVGLAARHWSVVDGVAGTAWTLLIPSRGALFMVAPGEPRAALDAALRAAGHRSGTAWEGVVEVDLASEQRGPGAVVGGSDEFEGLRGRYTESWNVRGVGESGELRGTIELSTVTFHDP